MQDTTRGKARTRIIVRELTPRDQLGIRAGWSGLALLLIGLLLYVNENAFRWYVLASLVAGSLGLIAFLVLRAPALKRQFLTRGVASQTNSAILIVSVLGILVLINYVAARHRAQWDLTRIKQFTLSSMTRNILKSLKVKVEATAFFPTRGFGAVNRQKVKDLLEQYAVVSPNFTYRMVDPDRNPSEAIAKSIKNYPTVLFEAANGKREETFGTEEKDFTGVLLKLTKEGKKKIYFLIGHGEASPDNFDPQGLSQARQMLQDQQYEVQTLSLPGKRELPDDCAVLVIAGPQKNLLDSEIKAIQSYLNKGGKALALLDPQKPDLSNLLKSWGVMVGNDVVLDLGAFLQEPAIPAIGRYETHDITRELAGVVLPLARTVAPAASSPSGVVVSSLFKTSDRSFAETDMNALKSGRISPAHKTMSAHSLAVAVTKDVSTGPAPASGAEATASPRKTARLVVIGNSRFARNAFIGMLGNGDLFSKAVGWLAEEEELVSIPPKTPENDQVFLTARQSRNIVLYNVLGVPVVLLITAVAIWWKRR